MNEALALQRSPMNVGERWTMFDTVMISPFVANLGNNAPAGWFESFVDLGLADSIPFFNIRNQSIGRPYNNQATRDQLPYAIRLKSIGIAFIAPSIASQIGAEGPSAEAGNRVDHLSAFFEADLPTHASFTFKVNQDERLITTAFMCPPGYGPTGGGFVHEGNTAGADVSVGSVQAVSQGEPDLGVRWIFPIDIDMPRRASVSAEIRLTEYARQFLQALWGPGYLNFHDNTTGNPSALYPCAFMIQITLHGERLVQQRGEAHV